MIAITYKTKFSSKTFVHFVRDFEIKSAKKHVERLNGLNGANTAEYQYVDDTPYAGKNIFNMDWTRC